jgi:hypothetical protein
MGTTITTEVTDWSTPARTELLELIDKLSAAAVQGTYTPPAPVIPEEVEPSGWTQKAYLDVITKLLRKHHVQVAVIFEAIKNGTGYVSRDQVYELGHYEESRSLKGFTRPVNRFTEEAQEKGLLPDDAEDLLLPDYDPAIKGFQRARGFFVPMEVVKLAEEWKALAEKEKGSKAS